MFSRWLLVFALICGMLVAPLAMAAPRVSAPVADQAMSHCAQGADADQQLPTKTLRCIGACAAVEVGIARLAARTETMLTAQPLPQLSSPLGILLERDTPPPRPSLI